MAKSISESLLAGKNIPLPALPRTRNRHEANITPRIIAWFEKNYPRSVLGEVKIIGKKPKPHQRAVLHEVANGSFSYKFPDGRTRTPCDFFMLKNADAFLVTYDPETKEVEACKVGGTCFIIPL